MGSRRIAVIASVWLGTACSAGDNRQNTATSVGVDDATGTGTGSGTAQGTADDAPSEATGADASTGSATIASTSDDAVDGSDEASDGTALPCDQDPAACDAWFLPRDANAWEAVTIGGPPALAPTSPVLAAFDIEAERIAFVLTEDEVIEVDLDNRTWVAKTTVADRFPEVEAPVLAAYSIPAGWGADPNALEGIAITGSDVAFLYEYDAASKSFAYDQSTVFGPEWNAAGAPSGADVRAMWLDVENGDGWVDHDVSELCNEASGPVGPYLAVVTVDAVHVMDVGACFGFFPGVALEAFAPTALAGAPAPDRIGAAAYNETTGLVVFAGQ